MRLERILFLAVLGGCASQPVPQAAKPQLSFEQVTEAVKPFIAQARATYPDAKRRFLAGLPQGQAFFVSVPLRDAGGRVEQAYVAVQTYQGHTILGRIASPLERVHGFVVGDPYQGSESGVMDWVIIHPDGSEEGKFIGRFLEHRL
ncbi:MAG: hypothetical protein ABIT61_03150 [Steroidobacteraceae bacterium]